MTPKVPGFLCLCSSLLSFLSCLLLLCLPHSSLSNCNYRQNLNLQHISRVTKPISNCSLSIMDGLQYALRTLYPHPYLYSVPIEEKTIPSGTAWILPSSFNNHQVQSTMEDMSNLSTSSHSYFPSQSLISYIWTIVIVVGFKAVISTSVISFPVQLKLHQANGFLPEAHIHNYPSKHVNMPHCSNTASSSHSTLVHLHALRLLTASCLTCQIFSLFQLFYYFILFYRTF